MERPSGKLEMAVWRFSEVSFTLELCKPTTWNLGVSKDVASFPRHKMQELPAQKFSTKALPQNGVGR